MKVLDKTINSWQAGILLFILLFANKILLLPSLLYEDAAMGAVFVPVILLSLEMGLLFLFYKIKNKFPNESFATIVRAHCGRVVKIILYVFFAIFFLGKAVLLYNVTYVFFRNLIYKDAGDFLFLFCFLPIINHLAICGLRTIGRTAQLFFPVISVICVFCIVVGVFGINSEPLIFDSSAVQIFTATFKHISSFGDTIFLFVIMDRVIVKKGQWKVLFSFAGAASFLVIAITLVFMLSYTYTSFMHSYALFEIMSFVKEYGGIGRIDIISMVLIIIYAYFHLAIYFKAFMCSFNEIFEGINSIYGLLSFNFLFLIIVQLIIVNLESAVVYSEKVLPFATILSFVIVPILAIILLCVKRKDSYSFSKTKPKNKIKSEIKKKEKNKEDEKVQSAENMQSAQISQNVQSAENDSSTDNMQSSNKSPSNNINADRIVQKEAV